MQTTHLVAAEIRLHCDRCGETGTMTREVGPIEARAAVWYAAHLDPVIEAIQPIDPATGESLGWWLYL